MPNVPVPAPPGFEPFPREALEGSIPQRFAEVVARGPERTAVRAPDGTLSYAELDGRAGGLAWTILDRVGPGADPVVLLLGQRLSLPVGIMAILRAGRPYVPLDPAHPPARLAALLEDSGARLLLADRETLPLARRLAGGTVDVLEIDPSDAGAFPTAAGPALDGNTLAYIYYTSGSTGPPKGVHDTHRNVLHNVLRYTNGLKIAPGDRLTLLQRPGFSGAVSSFFGAVLNGATSCMFDLTAEGPDTLAGWLAAERITIYHSVPAIFREVAARAGPYPSLRLVRLEGDRAAARDAELFRTAFEPPCLLVNGLGATECGIVRRFVLDHVSALPGGGLPIGYAVEDMEIELLDDDGVPVPTGEVGQIAVRSRFLAGGYWRRPELTAERFRHGAAPGERVYLTGDLGRMAADGCLEHLGRKDFEPRFRGVRVEVSSIEAALARTGRVDATAVVTRAREDGNERLVAYVLPRGEPPTVSELRRAVAAEVPPGTVPTDFVLVEALPVDGNGKVDIRALPPPTAVRPVLDRPYVAPRSATEVLLTRVWEEVLGVAPVGVEDEFGDLGGDSLSAAAMLAAAAERLETELSPSLLARHGTVEELAAAIAAGNGHPSEGVLRLRSGARTPFAFAFGDLAGGGLYLRRLARLLGPDRPVLAVVPHGARGEPMPRTIEAMAAARVAELRAMVPSGPYLLGGYCMTGGLVAFEMAQQLTRRGERVGLLALIDTFPPVKDSPLASTFQSVLRTLDGTVGLSPDSRWKLAALLKRMHRALGQGGGRYGAHPRRVQLEAYSLAKLAYLPGTLNGRVLLLWPENEPRHPSREMFRRGWSRFATEVTVTPVPGDHVEAVTTRVEDLAAVLRRALDEADQPSRSTA